MATKDDSDIPESGGVFTFGKSKFADNLPNKFWVKNDKVLQIACGDEHTALITESGRVFMFGPNDWGQLGLGTDNKMATKPSCIKSLKHDKSRLVACGRSHTMVSTVSGHVYSFGSNSEGQLGIKDIADLSTPKRIESLPEEELKMIDAGSDSSVALTEDGRVYVWGGNEDGKLGLGKVENAYEPVLLAMERPAVSVACGYYHTAIVTDDGKLYTMGEPDGGKLGLPEDLESTNVPQHVTEIADPVISVACGSSHTVALTKSGELYVFGDGESGQLGLGTEVLACSKPTLLKLPYKVSHVFCGQAFTACISEKGQLYTFGDGRHGKLAHGSDVFSNQFKPFHSKRFSKFLVDKVACGGCHMIVTARPKALNGVEEEEGEDVDEMKKTLVAQPVESSGSPSLTRTLSARERRRDEVSRSFSSELNQTLPPLGQSRILPSLSATMPALKSSPKHRHEDGMENGFPPKLHNGKISDADSGRDDTEEEDNTQGKHKKRTKLSRPIASPRRLPPTNQQESLRPPISPRCALTARSHTKPGSLPPVQEDGHSSNGGGGGGSNGDTENEEDLTDGSSSKKKKKKIKGKKRKTSKIDEENEDDSWNDDDDETDKEEKVENKAVKELQMALDEKEGSNVDEEAEDDVDSINQTEEKEDKENVNDTDEDSRGPVPIPRKHKTNESEEEEEEQESGKKDSLVDLRQESDKEKEEERVESEKESKVDEELASDQDDKKKGKKDKKDKGKKKKKDKEEDDEEKEKVKQDEEEEEEKEDSKKKGKDKKKDKKKEKDKDKKKKKGKADDEEEEDGDDEDEDDEKSDKKSKDKKKDKKDKKKDKNKKGKGDGKEDEDEEEEGEEDDKMKDKKEKDKKKKKGKEDDKDKDVNGNTEKSPPKKSRTCNIL